MSFRILPGCALFLMLGLTAPAQVPVPKSSGVLPVTADSYPFMAAARNVGATDLAKFGYVEEEFILSGTANVYDWAQDGTVTVRTANAPWADRILVRRPANARRFSGTVVVEIPNVARRFEWAMMWGYFRDTVLEHGDAWVTVTPAGGIDSLKKFNPKRYAQVSMANPTPNAACPGAGKGGPSAMEEGLRWDILSQTAAALKSNAAGQPMAGMNVKRVYMTTQAVDIASYINAIHERAKLANGKPAYDGYLVRNPPAATRLSQCAPQITATDPRRQLKDLDVPIVSVAAQGEVPDASRSRKADSDGPVGRYRLYEIAGAAHIEFFAYAGLPSFEEQAAIGLAQGNLEWPFSAQCEPAIPLSKHPLLMYSYHAALRNLDDWVAKGIAPPKGQRMELTPGDPAVLKLDEFGHAVGGVRNPWVDAPVATYLTSSPGPGNCRELGRTIPFDAARIDKLYPTKKAYTSKVNASVDAGVKGRFFTEGDGKKMKSDLATEFDAIKK
jgi:hypothetical protein